jgi:hypothetical protein
MASEAGLPESENFKPAVFGPKAEILGLRKYMGVPSKVPDAVFDAVTYLMHFVDVDQAAWSLELVLEKVPCLKKSAGFNPGYLEAKTKGDFYPLNKDKLSEWETRILEIFELIPFVVSFLKDEQRNIAKEARQINNVPASFFFPRYQVFGPVAEKFYELGKYEVWFGPGKSPQYGGFHSVGETLNSADGVGFMADIVRQDSLYPPRLITFIERFFVEHCRGGRTLRENVRRTIFYLCNLVLAVTSSGDVYVVERGNISGKELTLILNTLMASAYYVAFAFSKGYVWSDLKFCAFGDNIASATPGLNFTDFKNYMNRYGQDVTGRDGNWDCDLDFLSYEFFKHRGIWLPRTVNADKIYSAMRCPNSKKPQLKWAHIVGIRNQVFTHTQLFEACDRVCSLYARKHPQVDKRILLSRNELYRLWTGFEGCGEITTIDAPPYLGPSRQVRAEAFLCNVMGLPLSVLDSTELLLRHLLRGNVSPREIQYVVKGKKPKTKQEEIRLKGGGGSTEETGATCTQSY